MLSANPRLTLAEIAHRTGTDRRKIQRIIKAQYGCGFKGLKNAIRLQRAQALLTDLHRKYSVKEVAAEVGVTPNALSRFIKTMIGCCPTKLVGDQKKRMP
jgi:transcriptional regulator GlxA family with amidase domain